MHTREDVNNIILKFIELACEEINIKHVFLFGSYVKGTNTEYSDIDVAIVSDDFEGIPYYDRKRLIKYILKTSDSLELHPFRTDDFSPETNPFVEEIIKTGIMITWSAEELYNYYRQLFKNITGQPPAPYFVKNIVILFFFNYIKFRYEALNLTTRVNK